MKILIIGGRGYIGSYVSHYLLSCGFEVVSFGSRTQDYDKLTTEELSPYEYIIVLAGHSSVQMCQGDLQAPWNNNVRNLHNLIEKVTPDQKIIYASSASVYGNKNAGVSVESDMFMEYLNNYDLTKIALDNMVSAHIQRGSKVIGLRFGTVNGGSPLIRRELMLNGMVHSALTTGKIMVANSHISRPICFIGDLGRAVKTIILNPWTSGFYNVASFNTTVWDMALAAQSGVGGEIVDRGLVPGAYDFRIDTKAFEDTYRFTFQGTPEIIVEDLKNWYSKGTPTVTRSEYFSYLG